jgi:hypothetical protein
MKSIYLQAINCMFLQIRTDFNIILLGRHPSPAAESLPRTCCGGSGLSHKGRGKSSRRIYSTTPPQGERQYSSLSHLFNNALCGKGKSSSVLIYSTTPLAHQSFREQLTNNKMSSRKMSAQENRTKPLLKRGHLCGIRCCPPNCEVKTGSRTNTRDTTSLRSRNLNGYFAG